MSRYEKHYTVLSHDVNVNGNLRPSLVAKFMQETANHHMRDRKPTYYDLFEEGKSYILTRMVIEIRDEFHMYEDVDSYTWSCDSKAATFIRSYLLERNGREAARAYSEWAVANRNTGKLCLVREIDVSNYERDIPLDMKIPVKFKFPKTAAWEETTGKLVEYGEVDMNMHMNNTYYPDMIWNRLPGVESKKMTSLSIRFMAEAPLGEKIRIFRSKLAEPLDDGCGAEESWYFKSMVKGRTNIEAIISAARCDTP